MKKKTSIEMNKTRSILNYFKIHFVTLSLRHFITLLIVSHLISLPTWSYEDCIITTNGKLSNIKIQHNDIIDVFPLITILNDKNTLIVHPLKEGETKFTVIKNNKDKFLFDVKVKENVTILKDVEGFELFTIDAPPNAYEYYFDLDEPLAPDKDDDFINNLDEPPVLRGK